MSNTESLLSTDRLDLLRLFVRTAEVGKISIAGESLGLSQPSASRLLKRLETIANCRLLKRSAQGIQLTPDGEEFLHAARRVLGEWERALERARSKRQTIAGHIRVAAPIAIGQNLLPAIASQFLLTQPEITIDWDLRDDQFDFHAAGYDLWIRAGEFEKESLVVHEIYQVQRAIVSAPGLNGIEHPSELEGKKAVRLHTFVPKIVPLRHDNGAEFHLRQSCVFTTDNLYAAHTAVTEGLGYAVLPLWAVNMDLERKRLLHLCRGWQPEPVIVALAYLPDARRPARVTALIEFLRQQLTDEDGMGLTFMASLGALDSVEVI